MLEEIRQQPEALERTLRAETRRVERFRNRISKRRPRLIILAARGTSDNAAQFGRYLLEITTGISVSLAAASIYTLYANAFEFALKLMETCYVVAERFSTADFLHGPIAMVEPNFPVFLFAPSGVTWPGMRSALEKLREVKAETIVLTDAGNAKASECATRLIRSPRKLRELFTPIPYIIPAQLFAARLAAQKGLDPDKPRSLSKVTLTL